MSTETVTRDESLRLGVFSTRTFAAVAGAFAVVGLALGVAGFLIGHSGQGQISRQALGMMMFAIIPFGGIFVVTILGVAESRRLGDALTAAVSLGVAGGVGHLLLFGLAMPLVMLQPIDPPIPELSIVAVWLRATLATAFAGALVGVLGEKL